MLKKILLSFFLLVIGQIVFANETLVNVYSPVKISTSNLKLQEGDSVEFVVCDDVYLRSKLYLKKGEKVFGMITSIEPNDFGCKEAVIYAENFKTKNVDGKLIRINGVICKRGRTHWMFTQILPGLPEFIRGGESHIKPKDKFNLYLEENL